MTQQGLTLDEFNLETWYESQERANIQWSGAAADLQLINTRRPTLVINDDGEIEEEQDDVTLNLIYEDLLGGPFHRTTTSGDYSTGYSARSYGEVIPVFIKRQWMFCGEVPTNISSRDQQEIILECLPGSFVYRDNNDKASISTPDFITPTA